MSEIELKISASNNATYPKIMLRKFFNMVFISEDGKKLNIYTATVFGAISSAENQGEANTIPDISYDQSNMRCALNFQYKGDSICEDKVRFEDKTQSLWEQTNYVSKVWGACEKVDTQEDVERIFRKIYPNIKMKKDIDMSSNSICHISESDKKSHECIVTKGIYKKLPENDVGYTLSSNSDMECDGMEFMNWVKTEISLSASILNKYVKFKIELDGEGEYYTPDFTWYFAPPMGYIVDEESAKVKICGENKRNLVQTVADDTTVHFREWVYDEEIDDRRKARVYISPEINKDPWMLSKNVTTVSIRIDNPKHMENKQYFLGLLLGFVLSFCADKTRINDYNTCIKQICDCGKNCMCGQVYNTLGFIFPILAVTTYFSAVFQVKKCVPVRKAVLRRIFGITKIISAVATGFVLIYVFFAWLVLPDLMQKLIASCRLNNSIIFLLSGLGMVLNLLYLLYCMVCRKKKIFDYL